MALTKSTTEIDAWEEIDTGGLREGAAADVSDSYGAMLHIDCCPCEAGAHTGTEIIVQIGTDTSDADDNWSNLTRYVCCVGTIIVQALGQEEAAGQTVLTMAGDVGTANMDNNKKFKFLEDATDANSEIVYQVSESGNDITILDALVHTHATTTSILCDIDSATAEAVSMQQVAVPAAADRVRVLYNNNYDADGMAVFTRCRISKLTGV